MPVLLVEDDERIVEFVRCGLEAEGHVVEVARTGSAALELAMSARFEVIVLDLLLPGIDGREVCRRLRALNKATPILMLTALDTLEDKVTGLRLGADDYLTKPFAFEELLARIEALLRRGDGYEEVAAVELVVGDLVLNREMRTVRRDARPIQLTAKEFTLLEALMSRPGAVLSRTKLLEKVWGYSADPLTNVVEVYIRQLRRKVDEGEPKPLIQTVRGFGYKIAAE